MTIKVKFNCGPHPLALRGNGPIYPIIELVRELKIRGTMSKTAINYTEPFWRYPAKRWTDGQNDHMKYLTLLRINKLPNLLIPWSKSIPMGDRINAENQVHRNQ